MASPSGASSSAWGVNALNDHVELRGLVRNLFDASYPASPDPGAVLAPGVSVLITTVLAF